MAKSGNTPYSVDPCCPIESYYNPKPPKKSIAYASRRKRHKRVNTEFHDALFSLGADDRTGRLSDAEFQRQVMSEIGYLFSLGFSYLGKAARSAVSIGASLFD